MPISYVGRSVFASGTAALTVGAAANVVADDLILLFVESANQPVAAPTGYTAVTGGSVQAGTAAAAGGMALQVFYRIATGADDTVFVADSGDHTTAIKLVYREVDTANPFDVTPVTATKTTASTSSTYPSITTVTPGTRIIFASALDLDANSTATTSGQSIAAFNLTEVNDQTVASGLGGGIVIAHSSTTWASTGATGAMTATVTNTQQVYITLALRPKAQQFTLDAGPNATVAVTDFDAGLKYIPGLAADVQSYAVEYFDAGVAANRRLVADVASFTATAFDATLTWFDLTGYAVVADVQGYTVAHTDTDLRATRRLVADVASLVASTTDTALTTSKGLVADARTYTVTGTDTGLRATRLLAADARAITASDLQVNLQATRLLAADSANVTTTTVAAVVQATRRLSADVRTLTATAFDTGLHFGRHLLADTQNTVVTTVNAGRNLSMVAGSSAVVVTFVDAVVNAGNIFRADAGSFLTSSTDTGLRVTRRLVADQRAYSTTTTDTGVRVARQLTADQGGYTHTAFDTTLFRDRRVKADQASYVSGLLEADLRKTFRLLGGTAGYVLTGYSADAQKTRIFGVSAGAFYVASYNSGLVFSNLPPAFNVVVRPYELTQAVRPAELRSAQRPFYVCEAERPVEGRTAVT